MLDFPYPLTVRILRGYLEVSCPDLNLTSAVIRIDDLKKADQIGHEILGVILSAANRVSELKKSKKAIPIPSQIRGALSPMHALDEQYVSLGEAAAVLKVSGETIRRLCKTGKLKFILTEGKHRKISLKSLEALITKKKKRGA